MKRLWLAILLTLFTATAIVPCEATCPSQKMVHTHDCCMSSGHTAEAQCCAPHEKQPAALQANPAAPALHLYLSAHSLLAAHTALLTCSVSIPFAPNLHNPPRLVLRT